MESDLPASSTPRKVKFAPKGPTTRRKPLPPKREVGGGDDDDYGEEVLLRKVQDHLTRRRPQAENKSSVQVVFDQGVTSASLRTYSTAKEGSAANSTQDGLALPSIKNANWIAESSQNAGSSLKQKKKVYKEPWDYNNSDYPITLPLRRPYSGDPEDLDREEFGETGSFSDYDESVINSASDLGLMETDVGVKMLFLQLPADLPLAQHPVRSARQEASGFFKLPGHASAVLNNREKVGVARGKETLDNPIASKGTNFSKESRSLELPAGVMGKMLVYKSGAVKLKLGDILYDVSPGSDCMFAQNVAAINDLDRDCCVLGELSKRAVLTPDIESLLDPVINLT